MDKSLYAQYLLERTDDHILEEEYGFITWRYLNDKQCYVVDLYVCPQFRREGLASKLTDRVAAIAREQGCAELIGTVVPSCKGSTASIEALISYGMKLESCSDNLIVLKKNIGE